jgi:hypothetical protein
MYSVYQPNNLSDEEILIFVKACESSILENDTKSTAPTIGDPAKIPKEIPNFHEYTMLRHFKESNLVYKQTKNGEPVYLRKATADPDYTEEGYLTLEFGLINFYEGSKSFIYEQEFWDSWHNYLKDNDYIGWATILAESATTDAYQKVISMGLLGEDVHYAPMRVSGQVVPGFKKIKVTF